MYDEPGVDVVWDLDKHPYPWSDGIIDIIYASHVIEHLKEPIESVYDCHRIMKEGGELRLCYFPSRVASFNHGSISPLGF
jgi:predicted SAM-dependent methyltransferase